MAPIPPAVFATLLMTDSYLPGAMVLAHSLRDHGVKARLVVLVTLETISGATVDDLKTIYDEVIPVNHITNKTPANLYLMDRPDLISTFTKIELWRQTQYSKIVYIDADVVALRAPNELLKLDTDFAAVPDIGWPDCFNSGVMVLTPNLGDYYSLLALAQRGISFDGADQGLLNMHFREWERLSFTYNCTPSGNYQYVPAYRHFQSSISLIHFIGQDKPWVLGRYTQKTSGVYDELLGRWWAVYDKHYRSKTAQFSGQATVSSTVQTFVKGEAYTPYGYSTQTTPTIQVQPPTQEVPPSEVPLADQPGIVENTRKGEFEPIQIGEQRRFSAPRIEWDASRAPPPSDSKPEAANFPSEHYTMSADKSLFQIPDYPEPPKDMWYEVPKEAPKPEQVAAIFPWETRAPRPTRVFPREKPKPQPLPQLSEPEPILGSGAGTAPSSTTDETATSESGVSTPIIPEQDVDSWQTYTRSNAWDDVPEIGRYVAAIQRTRQPKTHLRQVSGDQILAPTAQRRRPSFLLIEFPTEVERPSLPVTPAPIRKGSSFWGEERESGGLPAAGGVPKQEDWNPVVRLEELQRKQSQVLEKVEPQAAPEPPKRQMPESVSREAAEAADEKAIAAAQGSQPTFTEPKYGSPLPSSGGLAKDQQASTISSTA